MGHVSNYYLGEPISDDEVAAVQAASEKIGIDVLNTRSAYCSLTYVAFLTVDIHCRVVKNGTSDFTLLVASADTSQSAAVHEIEVKGGNKAKLTVQYGDFSGALNKVIAALKEVLSCIHKYLGALV